MADKLPHITESALRFLYMRTCGWCRERISSEAEVYETDAKFVDEAELKKYDGQIIPLTIKGVSHSVLALVEDAHDLKLNFCSPECASKFKAVETNH